MAISWLNSKYRCLSMHTNNNATSCKICVHFVHKIIIAFFCFGKWLNNKRKILLDIFIYWLQSTQQFYSHSLLFEVCISCPFSIHSHPFRYVHYSSFLCCLPVWVFVIKTTTAASAASAVTTICGVNVWLISRTTSQTYNFWS